MKGEASVGVLSVDVALTALVIKLYVRIGEMVMVFVCFSAMGYLVIRHRPPPAVSSRVRPHGVHRRRRSR
jgi:hypothetical protein